MASACVADNHAAAYEARQLQSETEVVDGGQERIMKKTVVAYFRVLSRHSTFED
jgi:hypothetical protein